MAYYIGGQITHNSKFHLQKARQWCQKCLKKQLLAPLSALFRDFPSFFHYFRLQMATRTVLKLRHDVSYTTSRRIFCCVGTQQILRRDVFFTASERNFHCIRTQLLLRQDVSFTASERNFLPFFTSKIAKNDRKSLVLNRKRSVFAKYPLSFRPKIPQKHRHFADFMPKVVIGGNKVAIKTPLITTRYSLIIKELSISVANVALILKKHTHVMQVNTDIVRTVWLKRAESPKVPRSSTP